MSKFRTIRQREEALDARLGLSHCFMDSPSVPVAPDPKQTAQLQGDINNESARLQTTLNRADQVTPYGTLKWTNDGGGSSGSGTTFDQAGYDAAVAKYNQDLTAYQSGGGGAYYNDYENPFVIGGSTPSSSSYSPDQLKSTITNIGGWGTPDEATSVGKVYQLMQSGVTDAQVASAMGFSTGDVDAMLNRYGYSVPSTPTGGTRGAAPTPVDRAAFTHTGTGTGTGTGDHWTSTLTLDPRVQQLVDAGLLSQEQMSTLLQGKTQNAMDTLATPIDYGALPAAGDAGPMARWAMDQVRNNSDDLLYQHNLADIQRNDAGAAGQRAEAGLSQPMPTMDEAARQKVEDALYQRETSRLDPQFQQQEQMARSALMNRGMTEGSQGWQTELDNLNRAKNDAYSSARNDAITMGGAEQQRLLGMQLGIRDQYGKEATAAQGLASASSDDLAKMYGVQLNQQDEIQRMTDTGMNLFNNQRSYALNEQERKRANVLNELNAIRTGSQVAMPQFSATPSGATVTPANYAQLAQNQYAGQLNGYNAQVGSNNALLGGLASLGVAGIGLL